MAKKLSVLAIVGFAAFSVVLSCGGLLGHSLLFASASNEALVDHIATLDSTNSPTTSTTYVDSVTHGGVYKEYTYTHVKAGTNMHCVLDANGTITKVREALGLKYINVTFTGSLVLETKFDASGTVTTYELTSGEQTTLCGNYVSFKALSETSIEQITLVYTCTHSYANAHDVVETSETVLNGTDLDKVWKCSHCDYTETRMDPNGFNTYRNGEMINPVASNQTLKITKETQVIGGVSNSYAVTGAADTWNDKIEPSLVSHTLGTAGTKANIANYKIKYVSFDIYADDNTVAFRIASPSISAGDAKNNYVNFVGYTYSNDDNPYMRIFNPTDMGYASNMTAQKWYTVVIEYPDLTSYPNNKFACVEIAKIKGNFHFANVKYWHVDPRPAGELEMVWASTVATPHAGTYSLSDTAIGGRTGVHALTGKGVWNDQLDFSWTSRTVTSGDGRGTFTDMFYFNRYNKIRTYSLDLYLPAGGSVRLTSNNAASATTNYTNTLTAGAAYVAQTANANAKVTVTYNGGTVLNIGDVAPADTWYTITFDVSHWITANKTLGTAGTYMNVSLTHPKGTLGIDNVSYTKAAF